MCSTWAIFRQPAVSLPPTRSPPAARVAFLKCQSDHVNLLPNHIIQLPATQILLKPFPWLWGTPLGAHLSPAPAHRGAWALPRGNDTQRGVSEAPPSGKHPGKPAGRLPLSGKLYLRTHPIFAIPFVYLFNPPQGDALWGRVVLIHV